MKPTCERCSKSDFDRVSRMALFGYEAMICIDCVNDWTTRVLLSKEYEDLRREEQYLKQGDTGATANIVRLIALEVHFFDLGRDFVREKLNRA